MPVAADIEAAELGLAPHCIEDLGALVLVY
jgi:hypothetical protein